MFKKLAISGVLIFSTLCSSTFALANSEVSVQATKKLENGFEIEYLENTKDYQKIKFTNQETKEVEYLEVVIDENGQAEYTAYYNNKVTVLNQDATLGYELNLETNTTKTIDLSESKIDIQAVAPEEPGNYVYQTTFKSSKSFDTAIVSLIAGIVASVYGGPITGVATGIATFLYSTKAKQFWYVTDLYYYKDFPGKPASYTKYYAYPDYTNLINSIWYVGF
ncbi:hypothetical protein [Psychrobacillus sp. BM2]|uniref:hypothetical protein n=1 Tax=Psychrobacillus sp. BM2 TaxID=3400421 RepID=UPI003B019150